MLSAHLRLRWHRLEGVVRQCRPGCSLIASPRPTPQPPVASALFTVVITVVITVVVLIAKWIFAWVWPPAAVPFMILGTYIVLRVALTIVWNRW